MPSTQRLGTLNRRPNVRLGGRPEPLCPPFAVRNPVALISLPSSADGRQNYFNRYSVQQLLWVLPQQTHVVPKETAMSPKSNAVQIPQDSPIASLQKSVFTNCQIEGTMFCYESKDRVAVRKRPITIVPPLTRYMASVWKRGMENTDACVRLRAVVDRCALYAGTAVDEGQASSSIQDVLSCAFLDLEWEVQELPALRTLLLGEPADAELTAALEAFVDRFVSVYPYWDHDLSQM